MNNKLVITDNNFVNDALVYISAISFFIAIFPVHVFNYVYVSTSERYASINITAYRFFTILNFNTEKKPQFIGKANEEGDKDDKILTTTNWLKMFNSLCITKIVQLGDYGLQNPDNAYFALANKTLTDAFYTFVKINGGKTKLKNYSVLNYEQSHINYYLKLVGIINVITIMKLFTIFFWGKLNER